MTRLLFLCGLLACFSHPAEAAKPLVLRYAVYGGGVHVVNGSLKVSETKTTYNADVDAGTQGFLARVAPWSAKMNSKGIITKNGWQPRLTSSTAVWRDDSKLTEMHYDAKGNITHRVVKQKDRADNATPFDPVLVKNATDLPTGILNFFRHRSMKDGCEGVFNVYDGRRRYKIITANQRTETLKASSYNIFAGQAVSCTLEIKPDGGDWSGKKRGWYKIQEDSRKGGGLPRITVGKIDNIADWLVPVRLDLVTPWGRFVMHLTGAQAAVK